MEKESAGQKSRSLSISNPSPEGSQTLVFSTETREELEDWMDALNQHLYDQGEKVVDRVYVNFKLKKTHSTPVFKEQKQISCM